AAIADAPEHEAALERLVLVRRNRDEPAVLFLEPVAHQLDRLDLGLTVDRNGRVDEEEADHERLPARLAGGELAQHLEVPLRLRVVCLRALELRGIDAD